MHVEIDVSNGIPHFQLVGLPDASVRESRDRVRAAIRNSGFDFPVNRITINLAPGDVRKAGPAFDLPIALGMLAATGVVTRTDFAGIVHVGELSLDGAIQPARGVLPIAAEARRAAAHALCCCPTTTSRKPRSYPGLRLLPVRTLREAVERLNQADRSDWPTPRRRQAASAPRHQAREATDAAHSICPTFTVRRSRDARWKWPPPAATTC